MNPQNENQDTVQTSAHDPFPQPQTIPSGWDTSGFFSEPRPAPVVDGEDTPKE
ncbi:MAG: hypothetical protein AB1649_05215 [Chloroflexota bacterium]